MPPNLIIRSDVERRVVSIHVSGPLVAVDDAALVRDACLASPDGFGVLVNLSSVTRVSPINLAELRRLARDLGAAGHQVAFVCTELMLRAELIVGDLDTAAPVLGADEQAFPLLERRRLIDPGPRPWDSTAAVTAADGIRHTVPMARPFRRALRLRTRVTLFFSVTALVASLALALVTYALARSFLTAQRESVARTQAYSNASGFKALLQTVPQSTSEQISNQMSSVPTESTGFAMLEVDSSTGIRRFLSDQNFPEDAFPTSLREMVDADQSGQQRFSLNGEPYVAVGVYIRSTDSRYFEAFPLTDTNRTLAYLATALAIGAGVTTLFAAGLGWWTSRRLLRPLSRVSIAASEIANGGLDVRMAPEEDPDLALLASSFNGMADAVQTRIEREVRFASDVSHELRSPITALAAAVEVLDSRRNDLPERSQQALDVVVGQVRRFDQMVMDLLELSRIDAGSTELQREAVDPYELISRVAHRYGFGAIPIDVDPALSSPVMVDKLRFERILANLLENAREHAGGPTRVTAEPYGRRGMLLGVEDAGPGVARSERVRIFERFARGSAARHRIGTGLGLALVAEHAEAHGGEAWAEDLQGGGAVFKVSFGDVGA